MPRPRLCRRIWFNPEITYFKPTGVRISNIDEIILTREEFEAIRLNDFENIEQSKAAKKMNISQPTFSRLLECGRKKIASALVNGNAIKIQGGNFKMMQPKEIGRGRAGIGRGLGLRRGRGLGLGPGGNCVCPKCGYKQLKVIGVPCLQIKCPKCGTLMIRGN